MESSRKATAKRAESLRGIEQSISDKKNLRKVVSYYRRTRPTIDAHKKLSGKKAEAYYREQHESDFLSSLNCRPLFKGTCTGKPSCQPSKALQYGD